MKNMRSCMHGITYEVGDSAIYARQLRGENTKRVTVFLGEHLGFIWFDAVVDDFGNLVQVGV